MNCKRYYLERGNNKPVHQYSFIPLQFKHERHSYQKAHFAQGCMNSCANMLSLLTSLLERYFIPIFACMILHPFGHNTCDSQEERVKNYFVHSSKENFCAPLANGDFSVPARSRIHCAVICSGLPCCVYHSYTITSRLCYIHIYTPVNFTNESECKFMEVCKNVFYI